MTFDDFVVAARCRSSETLRVCVRQPVVDCGARQCGQILANSVDPDQLFGDVEKDCDVVRSEDGCGVVAGLCICRNFGETGAGYIRNPFGHFAMRSLENEQRADEIGRLANRREGLERMKREAAAEGGKRTARMDDDGLRFRDRGDDFFDGPITDRDEEDVALTGQFLDRFSRTDRCLRPSRGHTADRPSNALPGRGEGPGGPAASDDSEPERVILRHMRRALILAFMAIAAVAEAKPPTTCGGTDEYSKALCAYQRRNFPEAEAGFRGIVEKGEIDPKTIRAIYFLARTEMKRGRFDEAAPLFVRIYAMDPAFYASWNCDFLLGECRRAVGKD